MKVTDIIKEEKKEEKGTYAGVHFDKTTLNAIKKFIEDNDIPKPVPANKLHTTLLYSRKYLPEYKPAGKLEEPMIGKPSGFEKWPSQPDDEGNVAMCLVLRYDCPELVDRHKSLMEEHDATYDFDEYKPHITLSYDVGDLQCKNIPTFDGEIKIVEEYGEDLDLDWAKNNTKKDK
jgi:hypothetical protein